MASADCGAVRVVSGACDGPVDNDLPDVAGGWREPRYEAATFSVVAAGGSDDRCDEHVIGCERLAKEVRRRTGDDLRSQRQLRR